MGSRKTTKKSNDGIVKTEQIGKSTIEDAIKSGRLLSAYMEQESRRLNMITDIMDDMINPTNDYLILVGMEDGSVKFARSNKFTSQSLANIAMQMFNEEMGLQIDDDSDTDA